MFFLSVFLNVGMESKKCKTPQVDNWNSRPPDKWTFTFHRLEQSAHTSV